MKKLLFFLLMTPVLLTSCHQTQFIAEEDVYSYSDPWAMRPSSDGITPEASLEGFVYNEKNGRRSTFYDPQKDLNLDRNVRDTRVLNNYYNEPWFEPFDPWRRNRLRTSFYLGYNWNSWGYNPWGPSWGWNSCGYNPWGPSWGWNSWGYNPWGPSWGWNSWGYNPWGPSWGWNSWGYNNMGWNAWWNPVVMLMTNGNGFTGGNSGFGGSASTTVHKPRPNISSSYNPNNLNVGRSNISPLGSNALPDNENALSNWNRNISGRDAVPIGANINTDRSHKVVLSHNSEPWNPRVSGRNDRPNSGLADRNNLNITSPGNSRPARSYESNGHSVTIATAPTSRGDYRGTPSTIPNTTTINPPTSRPSSQRGSPNRPSNTYASPAPRKSTSSSVPSSFGGSRGSFSSGSSGSSSSGSFGSSPSRSGSSPSGSFGGGASRGGSGSSGGSFGTSRGGRP